MNEINTVLSMLSIMLTIGAIAGGIAAFKSGITRTANEAQERVINALEAEIQSLRQRITDVEEHNAHLQQIIDTLCTALKMRGLIVRIDGNTITIVDQATQTATTTRIQELQQPQSKQGHSLL